MLSTYLTALAAHDPGRLQTTPGVKYAENDQPLPLGAGEWQVAGAAGKYRHVFADPTACTSFLNDPQTRFYATAKHPASVSWASALSNSMRLHF
jgi:hypothetical protein